MNNQNNNNSNNTGNPSLNNQGNQTNNNIPYYTHNMNYGPNGLPPHQHQQPVGGNANKNINSTALQKLIKQAESKKSSKASTNPVSSYYDDIAKKNATIQADEMRVASYADVKSNFSRIFGKEAQGGLASIDDIHNINEKTEFLARAIIKKAFPEDKNIQGLLQNKDMSVLDKKGALYIRYQDALKHFDKNGKTTSTFYGMSAKNVTKETLRKIQEGLHDYRYKQKAKDMAKELGIIK